MVVAGCPGAELPKKILSVKKKMEKIQTVSKFISPFFSICYFDCVELEKKRDCIQICPNEANDREKYCLSIQFD